MLPATAKSGPWINDLKNSQTHTESSGLAATFHILLTEYKTGRQESLQSYKRLFMPCSSLGLQNSGEDIHLLLSGSNTDTLNQYSNHLLCSCRTPALVCPLTFNWESEYHLLTATGMLSSSPRN